MFAKLLYFRLKNFLGMCLEWGCDTIEFVENLNLELLRIFKVNRWNDNDEFTFRSVCLSIVFQRTMSLVGI